MRPAHLGSFLAHCAIAHCLAVTTNTPAAPGIDDCSDLSAMPTSTPEELARYEKCREHPFGDNDLSDLEHAPDSAPEAADDPEFRSSSNKCLVRRTLTTLGEGLSNLDGSEGPVRLDKRACWYREWWGCNKNGWCWARCGPGCQQDGFWCWTASNYGRGDYLRCASDGQCNPFLSNEIACRGGCSC